MKDVSLKNPLCRQSAALDYKQFHNMLKFPFRELLFPFIDSSMKYFKTEWDINRKLILFCNF